MAVPRRVPLLAAAAWAGWRLLGPRVPPRFDGVQEAPPFAPGRTLRVGRTEVFVREAGDPDAPPLVLVHGWVYDGLATWHRIIPRLAERFRVVSVDLRNHGKTDRVQERFEIADLADELDATLAALGLGRVPVVGYSMGGMTVQELARRHPARVERLVLAATAASPVPWPRWLSVPVFVAGRALARFDPITLPRGVHRYLIRTGAIAPEHGAWLWDELLDRDPDLYYEAGFAILRFDASPWIGRLRVPALCIVPTRDQLIPPARQRETAAALPDARVVEIEGGRHEAVLTHADEVAKAIIAFLDEPGRG